MAHVATLTDLETEMFKLLSRGTATEEDVLQTVVRTVRRYLKETLATQARLAEVQVKVAPTDTQPNLFTPTQLSERHTWLQIGGLRSFLFNRDQNGLAKSGAVIALTPRKLLIDEAKFLAWVKEGR